MLNKMLTFSSSNREVEEVSFDNLSPDAQVNSTLKAWKRRHCKFSSDKKHSGSKICIRLGSRKAYLFAQKV